MNQVVIDTGTPIGKLAITYEGEYVLKVELAPRARPSSSRDPFAKKIERKLRAYFNGKLQTFALSFLFSAATEYQMRVWQQIRKIPYGKTRTYGEIAYEIRSRPRPVADACRANRLLLIIPCHRVVGKDYRTVGKNGLSGWAGNASPANKHRQHWLLKHEEEHK